MGIRERGKDGKTSRVRTITILKRKKSALQSRSASMWTLDRLGRIAR
jgi:hypothetical protein